LILAASFEHVAVADPRPVRKTPRLSRVRAANFDQEAGASESDIVVDIEMTGAGGKKIRSPRVGQDSTSLATGTNVEP